MSLIEMRPGFEGIIQEISGDDWITTRLREMGVIQGALVKFKGLAPFGDPLILEIHGVFIALRKAEAQCILV